MQKIAAVWKKENDDGIFYVGSIDLQFPILLSNENSVFIFRNKAKIAGNDRAPDFDIKISKSKPKEGGGNASQGQPVEL